MNQLPQATDVPVNFLAGGFNNVTNSYKFYWLLAILDSLERFHEPVMQFSDLNVEMVASVWYPINYFKLSFGKQDKLSDAVSSMMLETSLSSDATRDSIVDAYKALPAASNAKRLVDERARFVPYRFLRPCFANELAGMKDADINKAIVDLAENRFHSPEMPMYQFLGKAIELHPRWFEYLTRHIELVRGFCLWHLVQYLQKNNPNVPAVSSKLFAPITRNLRAAREFWGLARQELGELKCIYTEAPIDPNSLSLDHFLPWSFVAHDLLWNIVPTTPETNSSKGDRLPDLQRYFDGFVGLQFRAVQSIAATGKNGLLEDHIMLYREVPAERFKAMNEQEFGAVLRDVMYPQTQIAKNTGFVADWRFAG